jgi:hypothetical protein
VDKEKAQAHLVAADLIEKSFNLIEINDDEELADQWSEKWSPIWDTAMSWGHDPKFIAEILSARAAAAIRELAEATGLDVDGYFYRIQRSLREELE